MIINAFVERFSDNKDMAICYKNNNYSYQWLYEKILEYIEILETNNIKQGAVVELSSDYSPCGIAMLFALLKLRCVVMPLVTKVVAKREEYRSVAEVEHSITITDEQVMIESCQHITKNALYQVLRNNKDPGVVILSSGTTGKSKVIVHNASSLLNKFNKAGKSLRIISFLLFDHIGGLNTLFYTLYNSGTLVVPDSRDALAVSQAISKYQVEAFTTSPTFLNLWLLSEMLNNYDCSSLKIINYGSELMPEFLLKRLRQELPNCRLSQAYGSSETGVLNVRSKSSDSLFIKLNESDAKYRVKENMLEIKSANSMLGYLNAPSPYTKDGWLKTGDLVEINGDYIKILGRSSDIINVGGEKVYPAEVENVLLELSEVEDVAVMAEPNAILGNIVKANVKVSEHINKNLLRKKIIQFCEKKLVKFMVPQKIVFIHHELHSGRFKKQRKNIN